MKKIDRKDQYKDIQRSQGSRRKKKSDMTATRILTGILVVSLIIAAALYWNKENDQREAPKEAFETGSTQPGIKGGGSSEAAGGETPGGTGETAAGTQAEYPDERTDAASRAVNITDAVADSTAGMEETKAAAAAEPESPEESIPQPVKLESLSGLAPGTILDPAQLDFDNLDSYFMSWKIEEGDNLHARINGKSYRENPYVPLSSLRYLKMPHYNFKGQIQVGELIVNKDIQGDVFYIFKELFRSKYQIQSMYLIDNYWTGDAEDSDTASIDANNTSAFCYREISGGGNLSNHAYGRAIDLNPQQNPYVSYSTGSPKWDHSNADDYIVRDTGLPHVITHSDLAYRLFTERGFRWGGDWKNPKDYQHFDKNGK